MGNPSARRPPDSSSSPRGLFRLRFTVVGHYCRICGRSRPNERFSGGGHRVHVCCDCQKLPIAQRRAIEALDEISKFLHGQSHISKKNVKRLKELAAWQVPDVAERAAVTLEVARVTPFRRRRFRKIRSSHPEIWRELVRLGLVWANILDEDAWTSPEQDEQRFEDDEASAALREAPWEAFMSTNESLEREIEELDELAGEGLDDP